MQLTVLSRAERKIKRRELDRKKVLETVRNPDQIVSGHTGRRVFQKIYVGKLLRVVCEETKREKIIVTACSTSQVKRY